ncbi:MAG: hypothetical protein IJI66_14125 [Erysipelotrichaceae bacterium]|nr:hypothetical protein [Erysipelotrichaceae bacterium]
MHSRIFQVSDKPVPKDDYYTEDRYYAGFCNEIADYVSDVEEDNRSSDIDWLADFLKDAAVRDGDKFTIINKAKYFETKFKRYKDLLEVCSKVSLDEFSGKKNINTESLGYHDEMPFGPLTNLLEESYNDKFGFYIDDGYCITLDDYMRYIKDGDVFYIGAVIDYHY